MKQLSFILVLLLFISCKKETVNDNRPALLTKSWKMTAWDVITPLQGTAFEGQSPHWYTPGGCYSEMVWSFTSNGDLIIRDAPSCIPSGTTGIYNSRWSLENNNKEISIAGSPFGLFTYKIISLTSTKLVVQRNENVAYSGGTINLLFQREYTAQ